MSLANRLSCLKLPRKILTRFSIVLTLTFMVTACSTHQSQVAECGFVSGYLAPDIESHLYRTVVTSVNQKPIISRPNYRLAPGTYEFTVAELISAPELKVSVESRQTKTISINVEPNKRYHLGAQFLTDKSYVGHDTDYWQPVIWQVDEVECQWPSQS